MTPAQFRRLALSLPEATQGGHMGHPDFRVRGKIFATLARPDASWGMVKLTPEQQRTFVRGTPAAFVPVRGSWGRRGSTNVRLALVSPAAKAKGIRRTPAMAAGLTDHVWTVTDIVALLNSN